MSDKCPDCERPINDGDGCAAQLMGASDEDNDSCAMATIAMLREKLRASEAEVARLMQKTTELAAMHSELLRDNSELSDKVMSRACDELGERGGYCWAHQPAPTPAEPGGTEPVCERCNDRHFVETERCRQNCTRCPTPCQKCRSGGIGAYCETTPCDCACHRKADPTPSPALPVGQGEDRPLSNSLRLVRHFLNDRETGTAESAWLAARELLNWAEELERKGGK